MERCQLRDRGVFHEFHKPVRREPMLDEPLPKVGNFTRGHWPILSSRQLESQVAKPAATWALPADDCNESLRIAREVGGSDLGRLLRTLSSFLRDDSRTRAELETRQSWVVNSARLAVAAPWILLGLLSLRTESIRAFNAPSGWVVLAVGGGLCLVAYRLMLRLGRLPVEGRVLR